MLTMISILASEEPNGNFVPGDPNELYWGSLAFGIIFVIFLWKGVPAISRLMKNRTAHIEEELSVAEGQKAEAEAELATLTGQLGSADDEAARIVADAREQATRLEADLLTRAEAEIVEAKERSRIEIQAQQDQALADLREAVAEQARIAADAVVRENLDDVATQSALIDDYISQLAG